MKILILNWRDIKNPSSGGAEVLTHEIAKYFIQKKHEITQFSSVFPGCLEEEIIDGVKIIRKGKPDARYLFNSVHFLAFWYYHKKFKGKFDVVIDEIHGFPFFTPFYVREKKIALICEVAGDLWIKMFGIFFGSLGRIVEKICLTRIYKNVPFITISNSTKERLIQDGVLGKNIFVIPMGINVPRNLKKFSKEKEPTLIYVGRVVKSKGIEDAIWALKKLNKSGQKVKLWVVGRVSEEYLKKLKSLISKLDLTNSIKFFGYVSEEKKFELLSRSWILIHPSQREGWGLNIIEANFVSTPAVAYDISGLRDTVRNNKTGILVEKNYKFLSEAVKDLIGNKNYYKNIAANAKEWSYKNFSWKESGKKSLKIIQKLPN